MLNPWADLPAEPPFIARSDVDYIRRYADAAERCQWNLNLLPSPYVGKPEARVYVLLLNPGARENDFMHSEEWVQKRRRALRFECTDCFWPLDPRMVGGEAHKYVAGRLRRLIETVGQERVARGVMWLQYVGYQSLKYRPFPVGLPSQQFAFSLLRDAMSAGKLVVIGRSLRLWIEAVPELADYRYIQLHSYRSPYLTPKNMGTDAFARVVEALCG